VTEKEKGGRSEGMARDAKLTIHFISFPTPLSFLLHPASPSQITFPFPVRVRPSPAAEPIWLAAPLNTALAQRLRTHGTSSAFFTLSSHPRQASVAFSAPNLLSSNAIEANRQGPLRLQGLLPFRLMVAIFGRHRMGVGVRSICG
jgi:hypothetical protein